MHHWLGKGVRSVRGLMAALAICGAAAWLSSPQALSQTVRASSAPVAAPFILLPDFTALVKRSGPAVVNVSALRYSAKSGSRESNIDPYDEFLWRQLPPAPGENGSEGGSIGSGFIIDAQGHILTSAHVVADADEILIRLTDKREFKARLVGADPPTDIALLKIDAPGLSVLPIGDSGRLQVGEWVMAIGSPFGFDNSVTVGVVSAIGRFLPDEQYVPFIQTDVPVNPGNSGGPLINTMGEAVAINAQILSRSGGYMGISFSIPIDLAMEVMEELQKYGRVTRGRLGMVSQDLNAVLAESFSYTGGSGALVSAVEPGGPAALAGLQVGDIIIALDGKPISNASDVSRVVASSRPGTSLKLRVWSRGAQREFDARVAEFISPLSRAAAQRKDARPDELGLALRELRPAEQQLLQTQGRLYVEKATGRAARAGVIPGDVILGVNNDRVDSIKSLETSLLRAGRSAALLVQRDGEILFVPLRLKDE